MNRGNLTIGVWIVSLTTLGVAGLLTAAFVTMAFGLDPEEIVTAGAEPWTNAAIAAGAFAGLALATSLSLSLWHFSRFRSVALIMSVMEAGCVAWACAAVYRDYF